MSRPLGLLLLAALVASLLLACGDGDEANFLTVSPTKVDFGTILKGTKVEQTVVLRNGGTAPVAILHQPTFNCSCFGIHAFQRLLQPGETRELRLTFDSWLIAPGPMRGKKLTITSNDWLKPRIEVPLEGEVVASAVIEPETLNMGALESGEEKYIDVRPAPDMRLELQGWRFTRKEALEAEMEETTDPFGYRIRVRVREDAKGPTPFSAAVELKLEVEGRGFPVLHLTRVIPIVGEWPD